MNILGAQKNRLIETKNRLSEMVLLSTHNICYGLKIRKCLLLHTVNKRSKNQAVEGSR